jgi:hypothetical protein
MDRSVHWWVGGGELIGLGVRPTLFPQQEGKFILEKTRISRAEGDW